MKKISLGMMTIGLAVCGILFLAAIGGVMFFFILPKIKQSRTPTPVPIAEIPGMEFAGPPILKPKTTEILTKTAAELDEWAKDLELWKQKNLILDEDLRRREELHQKERAALNVERERVIELQSRLEEAMAKIKTEEKEKLEKNSKAENTHRQQMAELLALMKVEDAVKMIRDMSDDQAARIFSGTKQKRQAKLFESWLAQFPNDRERIVKITDAMKKIMENESPKAE